MTDPGDQPTRGERRSARRQKERRALRMHGASLRKIYRDAILKRARKAVRKDKGSTS